MSNYSTYLPTKKHYDILDGLRGVAAIMVVAFHIFETHSTSSLDQIINHGYLAVDFFYVLSGFVVGYAYDDRWGKMTLGGFLKRRIIRLHPMVIMSMIIGAILFYFQAHGHFIGHVPVWRVLIIMLIGFTLIPVPPSMDFRHWSESYPLNAPAWSLFYEYIINFFYALFIRKFSNKAILVLVILAGCALIQLAVTHGDVIGGWTLNSSQIRIGFTRVMYPFFAGLLLSRITKPTQIKHTFLLCSIMVILILSIPRIGGNEHLWMNGIYDSICIVILFPFIVYLGSNGKLKGDFAIKTCKFFGEISYPIYIIHYPIIYIYWGYFYHVQFQKSWHWALLVFFSTIVIAYGCLKVYDIPTRKWLGKRFIAK